MDMHLGKLQQIVRDREAWQTPADSKGQGGLASRSPLGSQRAWHNLETEQQQSSIPKIRTSEKEISGGQISRNTNNKCLIYLFCKLGLGNFLWVGPYLIHPPPTPPLQILWKWIDKKTPPKPPNISISLKPECLYLFGPVLSLWNTTFLFAVQPVPALRGGRVRAAAGGRALPQPGLRGGAASRTGPAEGHLRTGPRPGVRGEYQPHPQWWGLCVCVCVFALANWLSWCFIFIFHLDSDSFDLIYLFSFYLFSFSTWTQISLTWCKKIFFNILFRS